MRRRRGGDRTRGPTFEGARACTRASTSWTLAAATLILLAYPSVGQESRTPQANPPPETKQPNPSPEPFSSALPTAEELRELVAYAEPVAARPHTVRLESFRGDTINGVYLVDSDLPTARHVAFGKDAQGFRYVWFSRRNPLRANLVALYQVDGRGLPDVLYWRQIDFDHKVARGREFRGPAAGGAAFHYSAGPPCGRSACGEDWRDLPLERLAVTGDFFEPLAALFQTAAQHGEPYLERPTASLPPR